MSPHTNSSSFCNNLPHHIHKAYLLPNERALTRKKDEPLQLSDLMQFSTLLQARLRQKVLQTWTVWTTRIERLSWYEWRFKTWAGADW